MSKREEHSLYHEAQRRASLSQPVRVHTEAASLLLSAPNNIIFELFQTIVKEISSEKLLEFITNSLADYLSESWGNKITQQIVKRLKKEQAVDIQAGLRSVPRIRYSTGSPRSPSSPKSPQQPSKRANSPGSVEQSSSRDSEGRQKSPPLSYSTTNSNTGNNDTKQRAVRQIYDHVMWRIRTENVTQITSLLVKLALDDGYKRGKLKAEIFEDVARNFETWRSKLLIKLYAFGDAPANDQRLILSSTNKGDLTKWLANYIDGSEKRQNVDLVRKLAGALRDRTKNCIYLTHDLMDAIRSLQTNAIRLALIVDRTKQYGSLNSSTIADFESIVEPLISGGKLYFISSLDCIRFAADPTNETCC